MINLISQFLVANQKIIRKIQWIIILLYAVLIIIPPMLPLPGDSARIWNNLTAFAAFIFWGVWWPFVLISIILVGRLWCGVLCPEGSLTEFVSRHGLGKHIPKWMRFSGWPFISFSLTTIYGQLTSVYQYPKPVILVLGGSTVAAVIIGFIYGKSNRVWCKYLCPVTGVFGLLAKLSPLRYAPDKQEWKTFPIQQIKSTPKPNCPTLLPLRTMVGNSGCLMCGKCDGYRNAIKLKKRSRNEEIVTHGKTQQNTWESILIIFGLCGIALAAFQWPSSFWLNHIRDIIDTYLLMHNVNWAFNTNVPWWIFTHYPEQNDAFTWAFGFEVLGYIVIIGTIIGIIISCCVGLSSFILKLFIQHQHNQHSGFKYKKIFNHLSQSLIPLAASSVFIGLFNNTITILQKYANFGVNHLLILQWGIFIGTDIWCVTLAYKIIASYTNIENRMLKVLARLLSLITIIISYLIINYSWFLVLNVWSAKSDSIPWNTLW